jgi:hypothetical protein
MDAPTVRILERILDDESRMICESHELRQQSPHLSLTEQTWVETLVKKESAIESFVLYRARQPVAKEAE